MPSGGVLQPRPEQQCVHRERVVRVRAVVVDLDDQKIARGERLREGERHDLPEIRRAGDGDVLSRLVR